jgi:hypothetical protein
MDPTTLKPAGTETESAPLDLDSVSEQMQRIREAASALLVKAQSASTVTDMATAVEKAAGAFKLAAEMDKARTELTKVNEEISRLKHENQTAPKRERSERVRDYVALLTPLVTIIALAATLIAQNWQFLRSESDKREEALDTQWSDAVKTISASGALSPGVIALQPFLRSLKYGEQARDVAVNLLASSSDPAFVTSLFSTALLPANWSNMDRMLQLNRALSARGMPLVNKAWDAEKGFDQTRLAKDENATFDYVFNRAGPSTTAQIGGVLKTPRPPGTHVDLSSTYFISGDRKGVDLTGANLEGAYFDQMDLQEAELKGVTQLNSTFCHRTAWWKVKSISKSLLEYLEANYPFNPSDVYGPQGVHFSQEEYAAGVARLKAQLQ